MTRRLVDLSVTVDEETKSPPSTDVRVELTRYQRGPGFWQVTAVSQSLHTGSHIDAPLHCYADGLATADIPLERVVGEAVVVDCTPVGESEPVGVQELEAARADVREGDIVLLHTGWSDRWWGNFPDYFTRSPYLTAEAAEWPVAQRPGALGFDFFGANDVSSRDVQHSESQWIRSKSFDGFCPIGRWITTADEVPEPQHLALSTSANGEVRQSSNTNQMLFGVADLLPHLSHGGTLQPGDLVLTGTPPGGAYDIPNQPWLRPRDVVRCEVERLGHIENRFVAPPGGSQPRDKGGAHAVATQSDLVTDLSRGSAGNR